MKYIIFSMPEVVTSNSKVGDFHSVEIRVQSAPSIGNHFHQSRNRCVHIEKMNC